RSAGGMAEDRTIVVLFPDTGRNYLSKLYSDDWMIEHGFLEYARAGITVQDILEAKTGRVPPIVAVSGEDTVGHAIELMRQYDVSQLPVLLDQVPVASVGESTIMRRLVARETVPNEPVQRILESTLPTVDVADDVQRLYGALQEKHTVVVLRSQRAVGVLTMMDVITYHTKQK
ncbi:MAG: CBS domain-containing protein, partial [Candidatus Geothermarchaeales archaeon]